MEEFTASQARALMPNRVNEMVVRIHRFVRDAAREGDEEVVAKFSGNFNVNGAPFKTKSILESEGYQVTLSIGAKCIEFQVSWRES